jgi:putative nucleotidyltransferase-like protein
MTRPEARLLLACARAVQDDDGRRAVAALAGSGIDWQRFEALAVRHGLVPLVHRHLDALGPGLVPKPHLAALWARAEVIARRSRAMARELEGVVGVLAAHGIAVAPYKGPALALSLYGEVALRDFGDLDLLVRPQDALRARDALAARGYSPQFALPRHLERALVDSRRHDELPLADTARGFLVELHWRTDPDHDVLDADIWQRLEPVVIGETTVGTLPARELLLVLGLHGTKHLWSSLNWLVDVAELLRRNPDGHWLLARARALGCLRRLALGLRLARDLLQAPIPAALQPAIEDERVARLAERLAPSLLEPDYCAPGTVAYLVALSRLQDSPMAQARYLARTALTPTLGDWLAHPLPHGLSFLYLPLRIPRLARKYLGRSA